MPDTATPTGTIAPGADATVAPGGGVAAAHDATSSAADGTSEAPGEGVLSEDQVKLALRRVKDPELNLNVVDLGLIYDIAVEDSAVKIEMSLT